MEQSNAVSVVNIAKFKKYVDFRIKKDCSIGFDWNIQGYTELFDKISLTFN